MKIGWWKCSECGEVFYRFPDKYIIHLKNKHNELFLKLGLNNSSNYKEEEINEEIKSKKTT